MGLIGAGMIIAGLLLGMDRFSTTYHGTHVECSSVFGEEAQDSRALYQGGPNAVDACVAKRGTYGILTWVLIGGGGVVLLGAISVKKVVP